MSDSQKMAKVNIKQPLKFYGKEQITQIKSVSPYSQSKTTNNSTFTANSKNIHDLRTYESSSSFAANQNMNTSPHAETNGVKNIPSFLQSKSNNMKKSSLFITQGNCKSPKQENIPFNYSGSMGQSTKRAARMSQCADLKASSTTFSQQTKQSHKLPGFLQDKSKQVQKKRAPYIIDVQRPESSKQYNSGKNSIMNEAALTGSYKLKKSKIDDDESQHEFIYLPRSQQQVDPATEWVKKSWSKKKERKFTINDFEQIKQLGSGKYGYVYLVKQKKTNFICALKIIQKKLLQQQEITEQFTRELKIQIFLNHPNIIKTYGYFDDNVNIYIILEVGTGGQLFKQLKKLQSMPEIKVAGIIRQVCQAINQLHSHQIIHRDIKPQNIVIHQNIIKLCDFGWSVYCDKHLRKTFCGTPLYVGPQILKGNQYDQKIDIWSLGVMMYEMVVGENPFKITKQEELIKIVKDDILIPSYVQLSEQAKSFLFSCLQKNPQHRLSIRQLINHKFFEKYPDKNDKKIGI